MDRVTDFESGGCAFDPRRGHFSFNMDENPLFLINILLARLERISADSVWAHRASGVRGALLRLLEKSEMEHSVQQSEVKRMMDLGFFILKKTAEELSSRNQ